MDNKIKITVSFLIGLCFLSSCAFDGDITFNEIKVNDWANISYIVYNKRDSSNFRKFEIYRTYQDLIINKRHDLDDYDYKNRILQSSRKIIYNNNFILADDGHNGDDSIFDQFSKYYKIIPIGDRGGEQRLPFSSVEISRQEFDSIASKCNDCKVIDLQLLREFIASGDKELKPKSVK